jgi:hypothetical protein
LRATLSVEGRLAFAGGIPTQALHVPEVRRVHGLRVRPCSRIQRHAIHVPRNVVIAGLRTAREIDARTQLVREGKLLAIADANPREHDDALFQQFQAFREHGIVEQL